MINCVIFDLDGTLLNTLEDLCDSTNYALAKYGFPPRTLDEVRCFVGNGVRKLIERAIPQGELNPVFADCLEVFKNHYKDNMYNKTAPYPGIAEMLGTLKQKGIKTAVVSNKFDAAVKELCQNYFAGLIDTAIGENEAEGIRKKPAPDSILKVVKELQTDLRHVIYAGDSETDVQTAKNAGIECIGCTWGFRSRDVLENEGANYLVNSPNEIPEIIGGRMCQ